MRKIKRIFFNGGCIWGFIECLGCLAYIREQRNMFRRKYQVYGVSAGSVIGLLLLLDVCPNKVLTFMKEYNYTNTTNLTQIQRAFYEFMLQDRPNAYQIANKQLHVGVTTVHGFEFHHNCWKSNEDMARSLFGGASIPFFNTFEDNTLLDGGLSFDESYLPNKTFVVRNYLAIFPISAIPPTNWLCDYLFRHGYDYIHNKHENNVIESVYLNNKLPDYVIRLLFTPVLQP